VIVSNPRNLLMEIVTFLSFTAPVMGEAF